MSGPKQECCPLFTEARYAKGSSIDEGWMIHRTDQGIQFGSETKYVFHVPGQGRGSKRKIARNLQMNHCPFCGASPPVAAEKPSLIAAYRRSSDVDEEGAKVGRRSSFRRWL